MNQQKTKTQSNWQQAKLSDIGTFSKGAGILKSEISDNGYNAVRYGELYTTHNYKIKQIKTFIDENVAKRSKEIKCGDILFAGSGETIDEIGKSAVYLEQDKGYAGGDTIIFTPKKTNSLFLAYLLNVGYARKELRKLGQGQSVVHLYKRDLEKIQINLPPLPEQHRIVAVLETWDKTIDLLTQKIKLKKQVKKGLMQKLLTGEVRLPGCSGEWEIVKLGKLGDTYAGLTGKTKEDFGHGKPFISYMNIYSNSAIDLNNLVYVDLKDDEKQNVAQYGDLFFTTSSETPNEVGISSVLLEKKIEELYLNSFCFGFRLHDFKTLLPDFAKYYFRGQIFRKAMTRIAQGASRYNLSKKYFLQTSLELPNISEQEAIAQVLNTSDKEISILEQKLEAIKQQKKFLLNNLITGSIKTPENMKINT